MPKSTRPVVWAWFAASITLYILSLTHENPLASGTRFGGLIILMAGWLQITSIGEVGPFVVLTWYANCVMPVAWVLIGSRRSFFAERAAFIGLILSLLYLLGNRVAVDESGLGRPIHYGTAYWLWVASFGTALGSAVIGKRGDLSGTAHERES
jgi:hypothetical protein